MFFSYNNKTVNIDSVTNIVLDESKFIFNLDYFVSLKGQPDSYIPDYVWFTTNNKVDFDYINDFVNSLNWIWSAYPTQGKGNSRLINPSQIAYIKFEEKKFRIIFNLRNTIAFSRDTKVKMADFVYYDYESKELFEAEKARILSMI